MTTDVIASYVILHKIMPTGGGGNNANRPPHGMGVGVMLCHWGLGKLSTFFPSPKNFIYLVDSIFFQTTKGPFK